MLTKKTFTCLCSVLLLSYLPMLVISCYKDGNTNPSCETVVNPSGPAFIKVINDRKEKIFVDLVKFIPFGAEVRSGRCEIYGVPVKYRTIEVSTLDGIHVRDVEVDAQNGQTVTIVVGDNFF